MAGYTYTTLKQAIQDYTDNQETTFVANIDNFIRAAEERILSTAPLEVFRKNANATLSSSAKYLAKPTDWLFTYSVSIKPSGGSKKFLLNKDVNFVQEYWPDDTQTGEPKYYSDFDVNNFIIAPTANASYDVELHYFYRPNSIVTDGTTWLGTNAGPALLYASLVDAYTFIKGEPDMIGQYEQRFQNEMARITAFAQGAEGLDFYRRSGA
jgi:hypothetical protein